MCKTFCKLKMLSAGGSWDSQASPHPLSIHQKIENHAKKNQNFIRNLKSNPGYASAIS